MSATVLVGDCREVLARLEPGSVDAIVTDPPYELAFMGRSWDSAGVSFDHETWRACLRVLKPGGHLLAFGGTRTVHRIACAIEDAGFEVRDQIVWLYGSGFPKSHNIGNGFGTALKPAHEPVIVARKPLTGTVAANVARHGTGALNIDGCRIACNDGRPLRDSRNDPSINAFGNGLNGSRAIGTTTQGRWPANVCLDKEAAAMLDAQSGKLTSGGDVQDTMPSVAGYNGGWGRENFTRYRDTGGASRFFYVAKASRSERNAGLDGMPEREYRNAPEMAEFHDARQGRVKHERGAQAAANHHPTVKPVALMRWLVRLVTPPGGLVVDPFAGSGTTGVACVHEGFGFVGIEQDAEYAAIARRRIAHAQGPLLATVAD